MQTQRMPTSSTSALSKPVVVPSSTAKTIASRTVSSSRSLSTTSAGSRNSQSVTVPSLSSTGSARSTSGKSTKTSTNSTKTNVTATKTQRAKKVKDTSKTSGHIKPQLTSLSSLDSRNCQVVNKIQKKPKVKCSSCAREFMMETLAKNNGMCGHCSNKLTGNSKSSSGKSSSELKSSCLSCKKSYLKKTLDTNSGI